LFLQVGHRQIIDATFLEEQVASARLHIFVTPQGDLVHFQKAGLGGIEPSLLREMVQVARKMAVAMSLRLGEALKCEVELFQHAKSSGINQKKFGFFA
jgi:exosome complex component RRP42